MRIGIGEKIEDEVEPSIIGTSFLAFTDAVAKGHGPHVVNAARAHDRRPTRRDRYERSGEGGVFELRWA
jgi:hypothetical protein